MLQQKDNWLSLLLLTYNQQPLTISKWKEILTKFGAGLYFDKFALYTETIETSVDEYGTFEITSGHWKGRLGTGPVPKYIQVIKVNFRKDDKKPFTLEEIGATRAYFKDLRLVLPSTSKIGFVGIDYYPYKDPFNVDRGLPPTPSLPGKAIPLIGTAIAILASLAYSKNA